MSPLICKLKIYLLPFEKDLYLYQLNNSQLPAIVRKVDTNETTEESPKKEIEVSDSISNEQVADESQEKQEPSDGTTAKLDTSEEDNKEVKGEE